MTMIGLVLVGLSSILKDLNNGNNSMDSKVILGNYISSSSAQGVGS